MCLGLGAIAMFVVWLVAFLMRFSSYETGMLEVARNYLFVISLSALPIVMIGALRGTLEGMSLTKAVFYINLAAFLINIPLDYVLVNGLFGVPKLGGVGCALATTILVWAMFGVCISVLKYHQRLLSLELFKGFQGPNKSEIYKTVQLGLPIGVSIVIEMSLFAGSGIFIAKFGELEAGAHAVAIIVCALFIFFTEPLVRLFSSDEKVIPLAIILLYYGAAFQIVDSLQVAAIFGLRAYQDTVSPPKYQFLAFWVFGLPLGVYLSFFNTNLGFTGAKGMWFAMIVSLFVVGVLLLRRLKIVAAENLSADFHSAEILKPEQRSL